MLKLAGVLIIINALIITAWWVGQGYPHKGGVILVCLIALFAGVFLVLENRVEEFTLDKIGTIKTAAKQASADAQVISDLKERVEAQSSTVDLIAKDAADAKRLASEFAEKNSEAEKKLSQLDQSITDGKLALNELQQNSTFQSTVLAAQNDDRWAFDQLWDWSEDDSFQFQKNAAKVVQTLLHQHNPAIVRSNSAVPWNPDIDPMKVSLADIWEAFRKAPPHIRRRIVEFVWEKRTDISKQERLDFLVSVLRTDESLEVIEHAGRYFAQGTGDQMMPIAIELHLKWWEEHKDSIE